VAEKPPRDLDLQVDKGCLRWLNRSTKNSPAVFARVLRRGCYYCYGEDLRIPNRAEWWGPAGRGWAAVAGSAHSQAGAERPAAKKRHSPGPRPGEHPRLEAVVRSSDSGMEKGGRGGATPTQPGRAGTSTKISGALTGPSDGLPVPGGAPELQAVRSPIDPSWVGAADPTKYAPSEKVSRPLSP